MRFVIFGAGAIGGVVGARLIQAGERVVLVARGDHARAMRDAGLLLRTPDESTRVPVDVCDDPVSLDLRAADENDAVVLLAVKSQHTEAALDALRPALSPSTPIVCLQNGVENERRAARRHTNVYGAVVMCPAAHLRPGEVLAYSSPVNALIDVGRYPRGTDEVASEVCRALRGAHVDSLERFDVMRWKYAKLIMNLLNAVDALCKPSDAARELGRRLRAEGRAVLDAAGIDCATEAEDAARRGDAISARSIDGEDRAGSSSRQSLHRGAGSIETDYLNGEIALLGRLHAVPTPLNSSIQEVAARAATLRLPPQSFDAEKLLTPKEPPCAPA